MRAATHLSTDPELASLANEFGVPAPGTEITHEALEKLLGLRRGTPRYQTVIAAWRRQLLADHRCRLKAVRGVGFTSAASPDSVGIAKDRYVGGVRKIHRSVTIASEANPYELDDNAKKVRDHVIRTGNKMLSLEATAKEPLVPMVVTVKIDQAVVDSRDARIALANEINALNAVHRQPKGKTRKSAKNTVFSGV